MSGNQERENQGSNRKISRRNFVQLGVGFFAGALLASCGKKEENQPPSSVVSPSKEKPTLEPTVPSFTPTSQPSPTPEPSRTPTPEFGWTFAVNPPERAVLIGNSLFPSEQICAQLIAAGELKILESRIKEAIQKNILPKNLKPEEVKVLAGVSGIGLEFGLCAVIVRDGKAYIVNNTAVGVLADEGAILRRKENLPEEKKDPTGYVSYDPDNPERGFLRLSLEKGGFLQIPVKAIESNGRKIKKTIGVLPNVAGYFEFVELDELGKVKLVNNIRQIIVTWNPFAKDEHFQGVWMSGRPDDIFESSRVQTPEKGEINAIIERGRIVNENCMEFSDEDLIELLRRASKDKGKNIIIIPTYVDENTIIKVVSWRGTNDSVRIFNPASPRVIFIPTLGKITWGVAAFSNMDIFRMHFEDLAIDVSVVKDGNTKILPVAPEAGFGSPVVLGFPDGPGGNFAVGISETKGDITGSTEEDITANNWLLKDEKTSRWIVLLKE